MSAPLSILVVDDEPDLRALLTDYLGLQGFAVRTAASAAELAHGKPLAPGDRSVDIRILRLRSKLGEEARAGRTLRTVHGEGYVFDPDA